MVCIKVREKLKRSISGMLDINGGNDVEIVAKIENRSGVDNVIDSCQNCSDDPGVGSPYVEVPAVQKELTRIWRMMGKPAVTATEMQRSMLQ